MRVLVVTNFEPDPSAPQRGRWVTDQVEEVRRRGIDVEVFSFPMGRREYLPADPATARPAAAAELRPRPRPLRSRRLVREARRGQAAAGHLPRHRRPPPRGRGDVAPARPPDRPRRRGLAGAVRAGGRAPRAAAPARGERGPPLRAGPRPLRPDPPVRGPAGRWASTPTGRYLLFPANPTGPEKRHDRAVALAVACDADPSHRRLRSSPIRCRSGSTPPTPSSSPPRTRASAGLPRGARLRSAGPLDSGRDLAPRPCRDRRLPLRRLRNRDLGECRQRTSGGI